MYTRLTQSDNSQRFTAQAAMPAVSYSNDHLIPRHSMDAEILNPYLQWIEYVRAHIEPHYQDLSAIPLGKLARFFYPDDIRNLFPENIRDAIKLPDALQLMLIQDAATLRTQLAAIGFEKALSGKKTTLILDETLIAKISSILESVLVSTLTALEEYLTTLNLTNTQQAALTTSVASRLISTVNEELMKQLSRSRMSDEKRLAKQTVIAGLVKLLLTICTVAVKNQPFSAVLHTLLERFQNLILAELNIRTQGASLELDITTIQPTNLRKILPTLFNRELKEKLFSKNEIVRLLKDDEKHRYYLQAVKECLARLLKEVYSNKRWELLTQLREILVETLPNLYNEITSQLDQYILDQTKAVRAAAKYDPDKIIQDAPYAPLLPRKRQATPLRPRRQQGAQHVETETQTFFNFFTPRPHSDHSEQTPAAAAAAVPLSCQK